MTAYYNEFDAGAASQLRDYIKAGLIASGDVDERSIKDVTEDDLDGYTQIHLFAGVGGWPYALRLAGIPDDFPIWTGSCPCQPFSTAGKQRGTKDDRHLWPHMFRLVDKCRPAIVFGEQVAAKAALGWLDGVFADLEGANYACAAADLCAAGVNAPHVRQRLLWVSHRNGERREEQPLHIQPWRSQQADTEAAGSSSKRIRRANSAKQQGAATGQQPLGEFDDGDTERLVNSQCQGLEGLIGHGDHCDQPGWLDPKTMRPTAAPGVWDDYEILEFGDGKLRRLGTGLAPVAHGLPRSIRDHGDRLQQLGVVADVAKRRLAEAKRFRVTQIKGYGNAIVPQLAAVFIECAMDALPTDLQPTTKGLSDG